MADGAIVEEALDRIETLAELFAWRAAATPTAPAYRQFDAGRATWLTLSWKEMAQRVSDWTHALDRLTLPAGARVAILLPNGLDAVSADQASLAAGLVPVPMHALDNPDSIAFILADCDASVLILHSEAQWAAIAAVAGPLPELRQVVVVEDGEPLAAAPGSRQVPVRLAAWLAGPAAPGTRAARGPAATDLAGIVYTSGTTGRPKGVMLSHRNVLSNVRATLARFRVEPEDVLLSMLPLSHTFERTVGYYVPIAAGACVTYVRSTAQIAADLQSVRPTIVLSVPRVYERIYAAVQDRLARAGRLRQRLFAWTETLGWRRYLSAVGASQSVAPRAAEALLWPLLDRLVARAVREAFGGRVRVAVSGGAALPPAVERCLVAMDLPLVQGYGMTEASPVVAANTVGDNRPGTVGRPLDGVEVRLGERDELLVRGPNVMRGYWKRPEDTRAVMVDGDWLRTGDQAALEGGRVRIVGRIKEIIVTSTGEKIAPVDLEGAITADPLFEQAWVIGDDRPFITAFVVLDDARWGDLAASLGLEPTAANLEAGPVREAVVQRIAQATRHFPRHGVPRVARISPEKWTVQNGLVTPTLKLKRNNLQTRFAAEIRDVYAGRKA